MAAIIPVQRVFDKDIPGNFGNAEYRQERELLITIDNIIEQTALEEPVISYFLDVAYVEKCISLFGTGKSAKLTSDERFNIHANAVMTLRMSILRKRLNLSLRKFSLALSHSDLYKWFCGINRFSIPRVPGKSTIGDLENSLPCELLEDIEGRLLYAVQDKHSPLLDKPLDCSQVYFDCTCICANIHYPIDWVLLRDCTRTLMKAVARIRKAGLCHRMPYEPAVFMSKMNKLCMEMTFAKRKKGAKKLRKGILRRMKKLVKSVGKHAINHLELLEAKWETADISRNQAEQIIGQIANVTGKLSAVIRQAHERIIGERKVAGRDKILSIYEDKINVIVRHKAGADVEFGNTLYLAEQDDGLIVDWEFFCKQAPADSKMVKESHGRIEQRLGVCVKLMAADRGFDSPMNRQHLESNDIFNAICPRSPGLLAQRLEEDKFRAAQNRRSQTEARISILSNCFCGSPMKQKGFEHRHIHMGLSILSHNLWVVARLKIAQQQVLQEAA
jgi:hypothetical protein